MNVLPNPIISVIMPVYNSEEHLSDAIISILNQTFMNFEFLIINDSSKDKSLTIINNYLSLDNRIKLINNKYNKGISGALNTGIELAKGEYIARMDSDDISLPNRFEQQLNYLQKKNHVIAVGCQLNILNSEGTIVNSKYSSDNSKILKEMLFSYAPIPHPALMARSFFYKKCKYLESYPTSEDVPVFFKLASLGDLGNVQEILYSYRISNSSNSFKNIKQSIYYTIKGRLYGFKEYHFVPTPLNFLIIVMQSFMLLLPSEILQKLYFRLRFKN